MTKTVRLEHLIEKAHIKFRDFDDAQESEVFGVSNTEGITRTAHRKSDDLSDYLVIEPGSIAYNPYRVNVGSIGITPEGIHGLVSPAYVVFRAKERKLVPEVLLDFLKSSEGLRQINRLARGTVRKALRFGDLCEIEFPAIPYDRQLEILEHKQGFNRQHGRLLSEITHQKSLLAKLKQAILQEAIQGKLTADWRTANTAVEPASQLLHRIQTEKDRLIAEKKIRKEKPLPLITSKEIPFEIPETWQWCRLGETVEDMSYGTSQKAYSELIGVPVLRMGNISSNGEISYRELKYVSPHIKDLPKLYLEDGDILFNRTNSYELVGKSGVHRNNKAFTYASYLIRLRMFRSLHPEYVSGYINSITCREKFIEPNLIQQNGQANFNGTKLKKVPIPLPPLAEQAVIVERVEALMTTGQALEAEIERSRSHAAQLLQAVLKEAFDPT